MDVKKVLCVVVVLAIGYYLGITFPSAGQARIAKVSGSLSQTDWIAAYLLIGFIVYVVVKGQLPQYRQVIGI